MEPVLVITPPPTPNGRLHIGHVGGPFLRADMLVRMCRLRGREAAHLSHIDLYQSYVAKRAAELGRDVHELRDEMCLGILEDYRSYEIGHDLIVDNAAPEYLAFLDRALEWALPRLPVSSVPASDCGGCGKLLFEAFIKGNCGVCLHHCYGNVCENCTLPQAQTSIVDPYCGRCGSKAVGPADQPLHVLELGQEEIDATLEAVRPLCASNRRLVSMCDSLAAHSMPLTYPSEYGVFPEPLNAALNPWIEIYFAHLYGAMKLTGVDPDAPFEVALEQAASKPRPEVIYFFGVDNAYWYAFLFPHLGRILGIELLQPGAVHANFFMQLNGAKVSSSRNNVKWAADIKDEAPVAHLRTQLAASCPEFAPGEFRARGPLRPRRPASAAPAPLPPEGIAALVSARVAAATEPRAFSLEGLLNALDEGAQQEERLRKEGRDAEARDLTSLLDSLCEGLGLA